ncbi:MAG: hypothetical protein FJZ01_08750 [Candidatus Sericytochromatia bacterium]|nr:hypothetical protein [Candidatus Tanganyikabacteria bacterium]
MRIFGRLLVLLLALAALTGCFAWWQGPAPARLADLGSIAVSQAAGRKQLQPPGHGLLRVTVTWPAGGGRDLRGYQAQLIPDSTAVILLGVRVGATTIATASLDRAQGQATASTTIAVPGRSNLGVTALAISGTDPNPADPTPIARGTAAGVNIVPGRTTSVALTLQSLFTPEIAAFDYNAGLVGNEITITGTNFQPAQVAGATPSVLLEGTAGASVSATISAASDSAITFAVPDGAAVGRIEVVADGVPSHSSAVFWVSGRPGIDAERHAWDSGPGDNRYLLPYDTLSLSAANTWALREGRAAQDYGVAPLPRWKFDAGGDAIGSFESPDGTSNRFVSNGALGLVRVRAYLGVVANQSPGIAFQAVPAGTFADHPASLPAAREGFGTALVGDYLYVMGGRGAGDAIKTVQRSKLDASGSLGVFESSPGGNLPAERQELSAQALTIGDHVYVFGGRDTAGAGMRSIVRAPIFAGGALGSWAAPTSDGATVSLVEARGAAAAVVAGSYVYVLGGQSGDITTATAKVERARILDASGSIGPFADYSGTSQLTAARTGLAAVVAGGKVYVAGGADQAGSKNTVMAASILDADGNLGPFANVATFTAARQHLALAFLGADLFVLGGANSAGAPVSVVERAPIGAGGTLGSFGTTISLKAARWVHGAVVARNSLYVLGGRDGSGTLLSSIERSIIPFGTTGGDLGIEVR